MKLDDLIKRAEQLIPKADEVLGTEHTSNYYRFVEEGSFREFRSSALSFIAAAFGNQHPYYTEFDKSVTKSTPGDTREGRGIVSSAHEEMEGSRHPRH